MLCIREVDKVEKLHGLARLRSITGTATVDCEKPDSNIASGLMKFIRGGFRKIVLSKEEEPQLHSMFLTGRQVAWMIYDHFKISDMNGTLLELSDLSKSELRNDNLQSFETE